MTRTLITGATGGLGRALARALADQGHDLILDGRDPTRLGELTTELPTAMVVPGDITDHEHRARLVRLVGQGQLDLLVHNASALGPSPMPMLADLPPAELEHVLAVNVVGPAALTASLLPSLLRARGTIVTISSDAAVENQPGWGGYASSKAALDHMAGTWASENPELRVYAVDPGDMRTAMHQAAFPGEDISDRPLPTEQAVPGLLGLLRASPPSGRHLAADFLGADSLEAADVAGEQPVKEAVA